MDLTSYLAWAKWERYVVTDLCKARYAFSFGNLTSNLIHKAAMWLAASDTFRLDCLLYTSSAALDLEMAL